MSQIPALSLIKFTCLFSTVLALLWFAGFRLNVTASLPQIVASIRALNPDAKIVLLGYTNPVPLLPAWNRYFSKLNRFAKDLATQEGLIYVDIPRAQTAADGHPTVKGHQYIANQILNALK